MLFSDPDDVENNMDNRVEHMTPDQLVVYMRESMQLVNHHEMAVEGIRERAVMQRLQRVYGKADAGQIIKWVFYHYGGKNRKGEPLRFFDFIQARKWWTDSLHNEMQAHRRREKPASVRPTATVVSDF